MFIRIVLFELRYHFRRTSTYVFLTMLFALPWLVLSMQEGTERSLLNSPLLVAELCAGLTTFGILIIGAIAGMAVCRDFEDDTYQLFFTTPLRRRDYLAGRLVGALVVCLLLFAAVPMGAWLGTIMPWADRVHLGPSRPWLYLQPFLLVSVTTIVAMGTVFFAVGALTRSVTIVALQGIVCLVLYLIASTLASGLNDFWPALANPFGLQTITLDVKYWSLLERNTRYLALEGTLLWNRVLWLGVAAIAAAVVFRYFPFSVEALGRRRARPRASLQKSAPATPAAIVLRPAPRRQFDWRGTLVQGRTLTRVYLRTIVTDLTFLAIVIAAIGMHVSATWVRPMVGDVRVFPVTYLMTGGVGLLFLIVITAIYAGELTWRERAMRYDQVHDALPAPTWLSLASKLAALTCVQVITLATIVVSGIVQQSLQGYFNYELPVYFTEVFVKQMPELLAYSSLALFVQTVAPNKFVGHVAVIGVFLAPEFLLLLVADKLKLTFPAELYSYGTAPSLTYSDMNGYGPNLGLFTWLSMYWLLAGSILIALALRFARRGTDRGVRARWRRDRWSWRGRLATGVCVMAFTATGGYIYYNLRTGARFVPQEVAEARAVRYELEFKKYERFPQPKITGVEVKVDLQPDRAVFSASGRYTMMNTTSEPLTAVHVLADPGRTYQWVRDVTFDRTVRETLHDQELRYRIYEFQRPLAPGETVAMDFRVGRDQQPFEGSRELVANGTFFDADWFPSIGYHRDREISGEALRRKLGLPPNDDLPPPSDAWGRSRNLFTRDADFIAFRATVSTTPDQIAVAPGYLVREWQEGGRRYFMYDMGSARILNFYSFLSARYTITQDRWRDVDIQVFHDPQHPYSVGRMIEAVKAGLDYFTANFGPYQFRQFRILEFPRYRGFAQSFPNTVPFAESSAFIARPVAAGEDDVDSAFFTTLHELAHQWWAHQVVGAFAQGSNILSEMLAEYSALMVVEHVMGPERLRLYLRRDLNGYLSGRSFESRGEQTLARVTRQGYVWYQKGSLAMYALRDAIGEERVNAALRGFLDRTRFQGAPYPTADDLIAALREVTPPDRRALIHDLFETITLFDNRAVSATWRPTPDGRYAVTLKTTARKLRADDQGNERDIPIDDWIDIGVFAGSGRDERALFLEKRHVTTRETTFELVVAEPPARAGIDPYFKLIDRDAKDNVARAAKGG